MRMQNEFNYLNPDTWWIATSATHRQRSPWGSDRINRNGNQIALTRFRETAGLVFRLGKLISGKTYTLSGVYTNSDNKAYIGRITSETNDAYDCVRDFTLDMVNGTVTFTPQQNAEYDFLIWNSGRGTIIAESVRLTV